MKYQVFPLPKKDVFACKDINPIFTCEDISANRKAENLVFYQYEYNKSQHDTILGSVEDTRLFRH